ncbi:hypothetical protein KUV26_16935 [Leisingera daeponensis]|uniref:DUF3168 domain-containing protein n=1 Tax=Leisingera daeponensis TaxID=405746 RepID=A0ABS7NIS6_9RHOB|nr:hypothetical protein [Leisingera daeponensis]MBY6141124.1 hypothetical protein [Leisingera daeponensis]
MSDTLIAKELRHRFKAAILVGEFTVDEGGEAIAVKILDTLPAGWVIKDEKLPALYVFATGEGLDHNQSISEVERSLSLAVALMARPGGDPMDQLDDMQLAVELKVLAAGKFGLAKSCRLLSVEIARNNGAPVVGTRIMNYEIVFGVTPDDPSL